MRKLTRKQQDYFRKLLNDQLEELLEKLGMTVDELSTNSEFFPDPTDRASAETDINFGLRVRDREQKLIIKIQQALKRLDNNTFGICERCGENIDLKRLEARPVTTLCIDCKTEQERQEKIRGE
jgi:DnaK suppressor protein